MRGREREREKMVTVDKKEEDGRTAMVDKCGKLRLLYKCKA